MAREDLASGGRPLEIACDESGYEGEKLIGGTTDVFAHAGVGLDFDSAAKCVQELRDRIRSPATEYKANHVLREKHRPVLLWLLGPSGPLHGNAHVYLVDKAFFAVGRVIDLLVGGVVHTASEPRAHALADTLYRDGGQALDPEQWHAFLMASNDLMRTKDRQDVRTSVESFFSKLDVLRLAGGPAAVDEILALLRKGRPHADAFRAQLLDNPTMIPALDPLVPAIVRAVAYWGEAGQPVFIVHDRQTTLSLGRIAQLTEMVSEPDNALPGLAGLRLVESGLDPRVQVADFLAGVARKIASDQLNDRGDAELTALIRPYVDTFSIWGDDRSWSRLGPASSPHSD